MLDSSYNSESEGYSVSTNASVIQLKSTQLKAKTLKSGSLKSKRGLELSVKSKLLVRINC
jgi:hypothetical protein